MKINLIFFLACFTSLCFLSCDRGENTLYIESEIAVPITIDARVTHSLDTLKARTKCDTLNHGDSVIFLVSVYPSKAIRMQNYFWTINEEKRNSEFSFRTAFEKSGKQLAVFHLIDYYGDTLTDTLVLWVSKPPTLNDSIFIPAKGTQQLAVENGMTFVWNAEDPDPEDFMEFHFRLYDADSIYVDTILTQPYFKYQHKLPSLQQMFWTVEAFDSFKMKAPEVIRSFFFTKSYTKDEGAVIVPVSQKNSILFAKLKHQLIPKEGQLLPVLTANPDGFSKGSLRLSSLKQGAYQILLFHPDYPDYKMDTVSFFVRKQEVIVLDTLILKDTTAPTLDAIGSTSDTINISDSLYFLITEAGLPLNKNNIQIYLDSKAYYNWALNDSIITVYTPKEKQNGFWHLLSFKIVDESSNGFKRTFYLSPLELSE